MSHLTGLPIFGCLIFSPSSVSLRHLGTAGQDVPAQGVPDDFKSTEGGHKPLEGVCLGRVQKEGCEPGAGL